MLEKNKSVSTVAKIDVDKDTSVFPSIKTFPQQNRVVQWVGEERVFANEGNANFTNA